MKKKAAREQLPLDKVSGANWFWSFVLPLLKVAGVRRGIEVLRRKKPFLGLFLNGNVTYNLMGLITNKNCDFMKDPEFLDGYAAGMRQQFIPNFGGWNIHVNQWAAFHAKLLTGDFVECGVNLGMYSMSNITYIDFQSLKGRKYYLFDTFCGLDEEFCTKDEYLRFKDTYSDCYQFVVDSFKEYPNVVIVKGPVPKTLSQVNIEKVAYLSIDMNCALPELEALKYFWPRLELGAIVVLDDYGWPTFENQKAVADDFASSVGTKILSLPTGQGILIKPG